MYLDLENADEKAEMLNNFSVYAQILDKLRPYGISLKDIDNGNPKLEKDGRSLTQNIIGWQCAADPDHSGFTIDSVVESIVKHFEDPSFQHRQTNF